MKIKQKGKSYKYIPLYFAKTDYNLNIGVHLTKEPDMFTFDDNPLTYRGWFFNHLIKIIPILGLMSCGHPVLPDSLTQYTINLVKEGKNTITCPYQDVLNPLLICGAIWYI